MGKRGRRGTRVLDFQLSQCATRGKPYQRDRISLLPNEILALILSSLTLKEACRTSILSKRWINVWTNISHLDFNAPPVSSPASTPEYHSALLRKRREFVTNCVNKVLSSHKALVLDEFKVSCDLDSSFQEDIDTWLQYAFARKVAKLELNLMQQHFDWESLQRNYAFRCEKNLMVDFKSLKSLSLIRVNVSEEVLEFLLQNCKFLERLVVHESKDLGNLKVSGPSLALQHLEICRCYPLKSLTVCNSNIISLRISDPLNLVLEDVPMLVDIQIASLTFRFKDVFSELSYCFSKLNALTLYLGSELVTELKAFAELPQLTELKQLTVIVDAPKDRSVLGLTSLVRASPNLENFIMKAIWTEIRRSSRKFDRPVYFPLQHLKVVELHGYSGRRSDAELVKYFLENAVSLERIVIDCHWQGFTDCPWSCNKQKGTWIIQSEIEAKRYAKQHLERLIPPRVELMIL